MGERKPPKTAAQLLNEAGFKFVFGKVKGAPKGSPAAKEKGGVVGIQNVLGKVVGSFAVSDLSNESTLRFLARAFLVGRKSAIGEIPRERGGKGGKK